MLTARIFKTDAGTYVELTEDFELVDEFDHAATVKDAVVEAIARGCQFIGLYERAEGEDWCPEEISWTMDLEEAKLYVSV